MRLPRIDDSNRRWWILGAVSAAIAMAMLDETVVAVALDTIRDDLEMSDLASHWIVNAYLLSLAVFVAGGGRLGDVIGHRPVMIGGTLLFGIGSLASGLAQSGEWIIVARGVQGAGAAVVFSITVAMIGAVFPKGELGGAFGVFTLTASLALGFGPFIGGLVTELVTWRVIFFINLPIVVAVIAVIQRGWREPNQPVARPRFDVPGQLALLLMLVPLVLALMQAPDWGWNSEAVLALLAVSALALPLFVLVESRVPQPLIDLTQLVRPSIAGSNIVVATAQFSKIAVIVFGALYFQDRLGMSPLEAGAALLVAMAPTPITGPLAGRLVTRYGPRLPTLAGVALSAAGLVWIGALVPEDEFLLLVPGLLAWGASIQLFFTGPETAVMGAVPEDEQGQAGGVLTATQMLGGVLAVAVLGAVVVGVADYAEVFLISAGVTVVTWIAAYLLIDRRRSSPAT